MPRKKKPLELPKPSGKVVIYKVGEKRPPIDMTWIPQIEGETVALNLRCDRATVEAFEEHLRRLEDKAPGMVITLSDAVRSLIFRGAIAFREQPDKDTDEKN